MADRIAQTVAAMALEARTESISMMTPTGTGPGATFGHTKIQGKP